MTYPSQNPSFTAIDWPQLNSMLPNQSAVLRILRSLLTLHQHTPTDLNDAFTNGAWDKVKDIAHKMRGTASLLAAPHLLNASQVVEEQIKTTGTASSDNLLLLKTRILDLLNEAQQVIDCTPPA